MLSRNHSIKILDYCHWKYATIATGKTAHSVCFLCTVFNQNSLSKLHLCVSDDSFRTHSAGNSGNAPFPSSSRNLFNSADQKNNGNKESQSRKMSM